MALGGETHHGPQAFGFKPRSIPNAPRSCGKVQASRPSLPPWSGEFARTAHARIRIDGSGYRRDLRALARRIEVAHGEVRIMGSRGDLLSCRPAAAGVKSATPGVHGSGELAEGVSCQPHWNCSYFAGYLSLKLRFQLRPFGRQ